MRHRRQVVKRLLSARRRAERLQLVYAYLGLHKEIWASSILLKYGTSRLLLLFSKSLSSMHLPSATSIKHIAFASFALFLPYFRGGMDGSVPPYPLGALVWLRRGGVCGHLTGSAYISETMLYTFSSKEQTQRDAPTGPCWKSHMNANRPNSADWTPWMRGPVWFNPSNAPWTSRTHRFHRHYAGLLFALRL